MTIIEKAKDFLKLNMFFLVVAAACAVYVARGLVNIVETGKTVGEIIADGAIASTFGFFISKLMSLQGIAKGEKDDLFVRTTILHSEAVQKITDRLYLLDEWCETKNAQALKIEQTKILSAHAITYDEFNSGLYNRISAEGVEKVTFENLDKAKQKAVKKARKLKITPLTASILTSEGSRANDPFYLGVGKREYEIKRDGKRLISKIILGALFGYFSVTLITDFSIADLIWTAIQVAIFLIMGTISYLQGYFFILDEYRHRIIKKIDNLQKFDNQTEVNNARLDQMVQE